MQIFGTQDTYDKQIQQSCWTQRTTDHVDWLRYIVTENHDAVGLFSSIGHRGRQIKIKTKTKVTHGVQQSVTDYNFPDLFRYRLTET